jgi:site-specific recombinase XerD
MEKGMTLNQIQLLLGHNDISTTSIYLKINPKEALDNYEKLW